VPNRVALLRAELEAAHPDAVIKHRGECGFSMRLPSGVEEHRYTTGPWHWRAPTDQDWREIDTDLEARTGTFSRGVKSARFDTTIAPNGRRRFYPRRWITTEYCEFGVLQWNTTGNTWATVTLGTGAAKQGAPNVLAYDRSTHAYEIGINGRGCRAHLTLKNASVARSIRWPVTLIGLDLKDGVLVSQKDAEQVGFIRPPSWTDASENAESHPIPWKHEAGYITLTPNFAGAVYPVVVDPDYAIVNGADDGYEEGVVTFYATGTYGRVGRYSSSVCSWHRFAGIAAAQGADCTAASIAYTCDYARTSDIVSDFYGVDEDDHAAAPTTIGEWYADHGIHTTATVAWDITQNWSLGSTYTSPDLSAIFDELFARANWQTGYGVGIHWDDGGVVAQFTNLTHATYENTSYTEPILSLTLAASGTPQSLVGSTTAAASVAGGVKVKHQLIGAM
jgi:hypothetical protein